MQKVTWEYKLDYIRFITLAHLQRICKVELDENLLSNQSLIPSYRNLSIGWVWGATQNFDYQRCVPLFWLGRSVRQVYDHKARHIYRLNGRRDWLKFYFYFLFFCVLLGIKWWRVKNGNSRRNRSCSCGYSSYSSCQNSCCKLVGCFLASLVNREDFYDLVDVFSRVWVKGSDRNQKIFAIEHERCFLL